MKIKIRWMLGVAFLVAVLVLGPPTIRTYEIANSADGLLYLASSSDEDFSWNPWSDDCYLIRQDSAIWLLSNYEWPYNNRTNSLFGLEPMPLISAALGRRGPDETDAYATVENDKMLLLMDVFISKGESMEERWSGLTALHAAILYGDLQAVELLVELGADLDARIERPEGAAAGMNSLEFVELLYSKKPAFFGTIRQYLRQHNNLA